MLNTSPLTNEIIGPSFTTTEADGDVVSYDYVWRVDGNITRNWTTNAPYDPYQLYYTGYGDKGQTVELSVTPWDANDRGATVVVSAVVANSAPVIDTGWLWAVEAFKGDAVSIQLTASDPDGDPLVFSLLSSLPPGLSMSSTGLITGTVLPSADTTTPYAITVTTTDGELTDTTTFNWTITQPIVTLDNPGNQSYDHNVLVSLWLTASSSVSHPLTYSIDGATPLPDGLALDAGQGLIWGTMPITAVSATPYTVTVIATDVAAGVSASQTFTITVLNHTPVIDASNPSSVQSYTGDVVSLQIYATDDDYDSLTFNITGLPPGLGYDSDTGLITGTISASADLTTPYNTVVTASDGVTSDTLTITWTVRSPSITAVWPTNSTDPAPATPTTFGDAAVFTARVRSFDPAVTTIPTGTVTFRDGINILATVTLNATGFAGFTTTTLSIGTHEITATYNGDTSFDASTAETLGSCTQIVNGGFALGRVWDDANANGIQDSGEDGVENVVVELLVTDDFTTFTVVTCATTDADGRYQFGFLDPGSWYRVFVHRPSDHRFTFFNSGDDPWLDSDTGSSDGQTNTFQVGAGYYKAFDSGLIDLSARPMNTLLGASAVPGNSTYSYTIVLDGQPDFTWSNQIVGLNDPITGSLFRQNYDSNTNTTLVSKIITYGNAAPGDVIEKVSVGGVIISSKEVYVVQVSVSYGADLSYSGTPGPVESLLNYEHGGVGGVACKGVSSAPIGAAGAEWSANVTLTGPGDNLGVDQIHVGFVQHITMQSWSGHYANRPAGQHARLVNVLEGQTLLDMRPDTPGFHTPESTYTGGPWYDRSEDATFFDATAENSSKTISSQDTPGMPTPLLFGQQGLTYIQNNIGSFNMFERLDRISLVAQFTLDVAASTVDESNGANNSYWAEARANWTFNGTGTVGEYAAFNVPWVSDGAFTNGDASWAPVTVPTLENTSGSIFNQAAFTSPFVEAA